MQELAEYHDVVKEVRDELRQRVDAALAAGVDADRIILDPGLGFAKRAEHNWRLSAHLDEILALGYPVLVGASRKSYLGALLADAAGTPRPVQEREAATIATSVLAVLAGVWGVRVHDVSARWTPSRCSGPPGGAMTGTIRLAGLRARGFHGVYDFERAQGQEFVVDVSLEVDLAPAAASDDIADTIHYGELADRLVDVSPAAPVNLLERLADRLLDVCLADPRVLAATVTVHKPQAPVQHAFDDISVTLRAPGRGRSA